MTAFRPRSRARRALVVVHSYYVRDPRPRRWATALARAGWEVDVVCARDAGERAEETVDGVRIHRLPARRRRGSKARYVAEYLSFAAMALAAVSARHLRRRYRVVYVVGIPNFLVFTAVVPKLLGARVLLDMRDPLPEFFQAKYGLADDHPAVRAMLAEERISARFAGQVVTVVPSMAALYRRTGLSPERITVVWNAPDPSLFDAASVGGTRDPADRTLLYTGKSISRRYGVDLAVEAVARLRDEIPGIRLRIVGDGDLIPDLRRLAARLGAEDRVSIEAPVPVEQVPLMVADAWLGVQPNRSDALMRYSFSQKILEWCRLGLPVVCGATDALLDVFSKDDLLFHEPDDLDGLCERIREAHADPDALAERVRRARAVAERIRYEDQVATLLSLFEGPRSPGYNRRAP